jgi:hypothetical protein
MALPDSFGNRLPRTYVFIAPLLAAALISSLAACSNQGKDANSHAQKTFSSPQAAGEALFHAAQSGDKEQLIAILGPDSGDVLFSGDPVKDKNVRQDFVDAYSQMSRWGAQNSGDQVLYIGADNFAFPIPLSQKAPGQWVFNTAAGKEEILARRIGDGELTTIGILSEVARAEQKYFHAKHQYAGKFISDDGQQNGLYWPVAENQPPSPLGRLAAEAKAFGYSKSDRPQPFNGYYYKILTQQGDQKGGAKSYLTNGKLTGGFAVLAWPAKYRDSGIMSFLVGKDGVIYQKDLGLDTTTAASAISSYNPANGWTVVLAPDSSNALAEN